jgi:hypothetical protein
MSTVFGLELIYNQIKKLFIGIKFLFIRSTVFGLELIYNQIKRLFIGIKFLFIRIRYVLAPRVVRRVSSQGFRFDFNDNFNVNNFDEALFISTNVLEK